MLKRYTFVRLGALGEVCYKHQYRQSHRYQDSQHPNKAVVNLCPECANDEMRKVEAAKTSRGDLIR